MKEDDDCRVKEKITKEEKTMMISYCIKKYFDKNVKKEWKSRDGQPINETIPFKFFFVDDFELRDFWCCKKKHDENIKYREWNIFL